MTVTFRDGELVRLRKPGWVTNPWIRELVEAVGLPEPIAFLGDALTAEHWRAAERVVVGLRSRFAGHRFAEVVDWGVLLIPQPGYLDTREAIPAEVRSAQHPGLREDFLDPALPAGADLTSPDSPGAVFASVIGRYGFAAGSYDDITGASASEYTVVGFDTRIAMTRQLWGARLLQSPVGLIPDSDYNDVWTFTLFPGEALAGGRAASGTVLKGRVRFRRGKTNRGIGSARVAPAVPVMGCRQLWAGDGVRQV